MYLKNIAIESIAETSRWCGISVDAGTADIFCKVKGVSDKRIFNKIIKNIETLIKRKDRIGTYLEVAYKFLITPTNVSDIYIAAKLAREIGINHFHCRPCGFDNVEGIDLKQNIFENYIDEIDEQLDKIFQLETKQFKIFGVRHKFNPDFTRKINFKKCWAVPLITTFGANGILETCFDRRGAAGLALCNHLNLDDVLKFWNSDEHHKKVNAIKINECPRCTFAPINEIIEQVIIKDRMCKNFP